MRCQRCEGKMVYEKYYGDGEHFWGWRCLCCGDILDRIILENRGPTSFKKDVYVKTVCRSINR